MVEFARIMPNILSRWNDCFILVFTQCFFSKKCRFFKFFSCRN